jgi:uncharacterized metal-binding protein
MYKYVCNILYLMPSEPTHITGNCIVALIISYILIIYAVPLAIIEKNAIGIVAIPLIISCDLDNLKSKVLKRWGYFKFIWYPVASEGKFHRSILHAHIIGPAILCLFPAVIVGYNIYLRGDFTDLAYISGLWIAGEVHIILDKL